MDITEAFPSDYLKAEHFSEPRALLMEAVTMEKIGDDIKPALHFMDEERSLILNKTNSRTIAQMYGTNTDDWSGKKITLFRAQTDFQGKAVPCIRVQIEEVPF